METNFYRLTDGQAKLLAKLCQERYILETGTRYIELTTLYDPIVESLESPAEMPCPVHVAITVTQSPEATEIEPLNARSILNQAIVDLGQGVAPDDVRDDLMTALENAPETAPEAPETNRPPETTEETPEAAPPAEPPATPQETAKAERHPLLAAIDAKFSGAQSPWTNPYAPSDLVEVLCAYACGTGIMKAGAAHGIPKGSIATLSRTYACVIEALKVPELRDDAKLAALQGLYNRKGALEADQKKGAKPEAKPKPVDVEQLSQKHEKDLGRFPRLAPPIPLPHTPAPDWPYGHVRPWQVIEAIEEFASGRSVAAVATLERGLSERDAQQIEEGEHEHIALIKAVRGSARMAAIAAMRADINARWRGEGASAA